MKNIGSAHKKIMYALSHGNVSLRQKIDPEIEKQLMDHGLIKRVFGGIKVMEEGMRLFVKAKEK